MSLTTSFWLLDRPSAERSWSAPDWAAAAAEDAWVGVDPAAAEAADSGVATAAATAKPRAAPVDSLITCSSSRHGARVVPEPWRRRVPLRGRHRMTVGFGADLTQLGSSPPGQRI